MVKNFNREKENGDSVMDELVRSKSYLWTTISLLCSLFVIFLMLYFFSPISSIMVGKFLHLNSLDALLIIDSIISTGILCMIYIVILFIEKIHGIFVVAFCAIFFFIFWGIESSFFWKGFNPRYPIWYEVEIALNDFFAAFLAVLIYKLGKKDFQNN